MDNIVVGMIKVVLGVPPALSHRFVVVLGAFQAVSGVGSCSFSPILCHLTHCRASQTCSVLRGCLPMPMSAPL